MKTIQISSFCIVFKAVTCLTAGTLFQRLQGYRVGGIVTTLDLTLHGVTYCCNLCLQNENCYGVNVNTEDGRCEIHTSLIKEVYVIGASSNWSAFLRSTRKRKELFLRATAGTRISVMETWLGTTNNSIPEADDSCLTMATTTCSTHYRNPKIDRWKSLSMSQVTIELYTDGHRVAYIVFDGKDTDLENWMRASKIMESSWDWLPRDRSFYNYFSIQGHSFCLRTFFINRSYGGCNKDIGWFVVTDHGYRNAYHCCWWTYSTRKPAFIYSKKSGPANYITGDVAKAEVMAIFVEYEDWNKVTT